LGRYDLQVARQPTTQKKSSAEKPRDKFAEIVAEGLAKGLTGPQIAKKLAKGDEKEAKKYRRRIRNMAYREQGRLKEAIAARAAGDLLMGVPGTVNAVVKRAHRGRMDAARTVLEATDVHNPRVKHEHSGDITVKLEMPRPRFDADADVVGIADADVVQDD
jgi:hypothetical protein